MDQKLFDKFTRMDELLAENTSALKELIAKELVVNFPEQLDGAISLRDIYDLLKETRDASLEIFFLTYPNDGTRATFDVGTTILNFEQGTVEDPDGNISNMSSSLVKKNKDFMRSFAINCDRDVVVRLDNDDQTPVRADVWGKMTFQQYKKARITTNASTTGYIHACTNPEAIHEQIGESTIAVGRQEREHAKSLVGTHFTTALAQYAAEEESLTGLTSSEITITGVAVYAEQPLQLRLWLFETDGFQEATPADMDDDEFIEYIDVDLLVEAKQYKNANGYYWAATELEIDYEDADGTNEVHIGLEVVGAVAKLASGSGGNIWVKFLYTPRT